MKVALTVSEKRISPLFDCAGMLLVVEMDDCTESDRYFVPFHYESPFSRASNLSDLGIEVLICGAVSNLFANTVESYGIKIIPFVVGPVDEVINAYLTNGLSDSKFRMPRCGNKDEGDFREVH